MTNCTKPSLDYLNMCKLCNGGAAEEKEPKDVKEGSLNVGETSRIIYERRRALVSPEEQE